VSAWAVLLLFGGARHGAAQTQAEYRARVQALIPVWKATSAERRAADSVRTRALPKDTVRVGVLLVLADSGLNDLARNAASRAAQVIQARFGESADILRTHVFALSKEGGASQRPAIVGIAEVDSSGRVTRGQSDMMTVDAVTRDLENRSARVLGERLGPAFAKWLGSGLADDSATTETWIGVRIDLVTSPYHVARECYAGNVSACADALGIADENQPVMHWYDETERRIVAMRSGWQIRTGREELYRQCATQRVAAACDAFVNLIAPDQIQPPLPFPSRQNLVQLAFDLGGPGALARMLAAPNTRREQVAAAAGISADSLVSIWQRRALETRAPNPSITWGLAAASLLWTAICGAMALGSSRWR